MSVKLKKEQHDSVPIWFKQNLTIAEATEYTGIGRDKLYELTDKEDCPFVLWVGNKRLIKRAALDEYILKSFTI